MKKCSKCGIEKDEKEFPYQSKKQNKLMSNCSVCRKEYQKNRRHINIYETRAKDKERYYKNREVRIETARRFRKNNPEKTRATMLKSKYGITQEDYNKMLLKQQNKCAICNRDMNEYGKIFCVDHNHETNKVRGLLCDPCNYGLGFYEKHKDKYIEYLKQHDVQSN